MTAKRDVTIVMTTWLPPGSEQLRLETAIEALHSWLDFLKLDGTLHLHVADDGTTPEWTEKLLAELKWAWKNVDTLGSPVLRRGSFTFTQQNRRGVGASLNAGLATAWTLGDIIFHAVDDWKLLAPLDLDPWVDFLNDLSIQAGVVRFFPHPDLSGFIRFMPPHGWAMLLNYHNFAFGFRPSLWHRRLFITHGPFAAGLTALATEAEFNGRVTSQSLLHDASVWLALPPLFEPIESIELSAILPGS